jgi:hypothetical protein
MSTIEYDKSMGPMPIRPNPPNMRQAWVIAQFDDVVVANSPQTHPGEVGS